MIKTINQQSQSLINHNKIMLKHIITNFLKTGDKEKSLKESRMDSGKGEGGEEWIFIQRIKNKSN